MPSSEKTVAPEASEETKKSVETGKQVIDLQQRLTAEKSGDNGAQEEKKDEETWRNEG